MKPTTEEDLRRYARRLVEGEAFALALRVEAEGWTGDNRFKLEQVACAAAANYRTDLWRERAR